MPIPRLNQLVPLLIDQVKGSRVPDSRGWETKKVLTARAAIYACSICRNQVTRGLLDLADQLEGVQRIGEGIVECAMVIIRGPAVQPLVPTRIQVPNGLGGSMEVTVGVNTLLISEAGLEGTVDELARSSPANFMRRIGETVRGQTSACCRQQVWQRILTQSNPRKTFHVNSKRTREVQPHRR